MSHNIKKSGGLNFNPLLSRTEAAPATVPLVDDRDPGGRLAPPTAAAGPAAAVVPIKFTFYYTPEQLDRLDLAWSVFRRRTRGSGRPLSKSLFVRVALDRLLDDFDRDPDAVIARLHEHAAATLERDPATR